MMPRSAHQSGVTMPAVSLIWRNSISIVLVSSSGTIQRLIIGPLNGGSRWPGFPDRRDLLQVRQYVFDHARPDVVADPPCGDVDHANRCFDEFQFRQDPE